jgi:hypothetical protein
MKRFFLSLTFLAVTFCATAQWSFELWHEGRVVLETGDTLRGQVKYDLQQDLIQFTNKKETIEALTARKVVFCEIFDKTVGQYRQFYSLPYSTSSGYKTPIFFELIGEGKLTVLCRERLENQTSSSPYYYGSTYSRTVLVNKYYLLSEKMEITELSVRKADVMNLFGKHADHMNDYMKDNKLKLDDKQDLIKIVNYYNSLFKTTK